MWNIKEIVDNKGKVLLDTLIKRGHPKKQARKMVYKLLEARRIRARKLSKLEKLRYQKSILQKALDKARLAQQAEATVSKTV